MKIQFHILIEVIKKNWIWYFIFFLLVSLNLIFYTVRPNTILLSENDFFALINYPKNVNYSLINLLFHIYQIGIAVYSVYIFYRYELEFAIENIILRIDAKKWIFQKIVLILATTIIINALYIATIYLIYFREIHFHLNYIIFPIIYNSLIGIILITFTNIFKDKDIMIFISTFLICILMLNFFNFFIAIILTLTLSILNILLFNFKKSYIK